MQPPQKLGNLTNQQFQLQQQSYFADIQKQHEDNIYRMRSIYRLYTDYFSKDPFQSDDQPLNEKKRQLFEKDVRDLLDF